MTWSPVSAAACSARFAWVCLARLLQSATVLGVHRRDWALLVRWVMLGLLAWLQIAQLTRTLLLRQLLQLWLLPQPAGLPVGWQLAVRRWHCRD